MSDLDSLRSMGRVVNAEWIGDWPSKVGRYILNFGAIELISYQYLAHLEPSRDDFNRNLDRILSKRIDRILHLIENYARLSKDTKVEVAARWGEVRGLSEWRNRIAHNPVLPTWHNGSDDRHSAPDLLGIPDIRQLKFGNVTDSISPEGLNTLIDASCRLAEQLQDDLKKIPSAAWAAS